MNAYKIEAVVAENGTVILRGLPLRTGDTVEVIVLEQRSRPNTIVANTIAVESTPLPDAHYFQAEGAAEVIVLEQRFGHQQAPSVPNRIASDQDYLRGVEAQMSEWVSAEDEAAYCDL